VQAKAEEQPETPARIAHCTIAHSTLEEIKVLIVALLALLGAIALAIFFAHKVDTIEPKERIRTPQVYSQVIGAILTTCAAAIAASVAWNSAQDQIMAQKAAGDRQILALKTQVDAQQSNADNQLAAVQHQIALQQKSLNQREAEILDVGLARVRLLQDTIEKLDQVLLDEAAEFHRRLTEFGGVDDQLKEIAAQMDRLSKQVASVKTTYLATPMPGEAIGQVGLYLQSMELVLTVGARRARGQLNMNNLGPLEIVNYSVVNTRDVFRAAQRALINEVSRVWEAREALR
jgi:hypothetical protein